MESDDSHRGGTPELRGRESIATGNRPWPVKRFYLDSYELMNDVIEAAQDPGGEFRKLVRPWSESKTQTGHGVLADLLAPSIAAGLETHDRDLALVRSLRLINALQQGAADKLPAEAKADPYTDAPLAVKPIGEAWLVYSVGLNGQDDGGDFTEWQDVGVSSAPAEKQ